MAALIDFDLDLDVDVAPSGRTGIDFTVQLDAEVNTPPDGTKRRTVVVDQSGEVLANGILDKAVHGEITFEPSRTTQWSFTMPADDSKASALLGSPGSGDYGLGEPLREVQLWRGDRCLTWGPVTSVQISGGEMLVTGADCGWYFDRRVIGPPARPNLLQHDEANPINGWDIRVTGGLGVFGFTPQTSNSKIEEVTLSIDGKRWLRVTNLADPTSSPFTEPLAIQTVRLNAAAFSHRVTFSALAYVEDWNGPNSRRAGLGLAILPVGWSNWFTDPIAVQWQTIDDSFPHGDGAGPQRVSVSIDVGVASEFVVAAIITGPWGVASFRDFDLDWDGGLEFSGEDQADIFFKVADHLSGNTASPYTFATHHPLFPHAGEDYGKSDIAVDAYSPDTGVTRSRRYLFNTQQNGSSALAEFADFDDGLEFDFAFTARSRTIRSHFPKMGRYRPKIPLRYSRAGGNILDFSWSFEGGQAANSVTVRGTDQSRRFGTATDASDFADSTTIEQSLQALAETPDDALAAAAERRLVQTRRPVVLEVTVSADLMDRGLWVGDRVPVRISHGELDIDDVMRITRLTLTPDDRLKLRLSPWAGGAT